MPLPLIIDRDLILKLIGRRPGARFGGLIEKLRSFRQFLHLLPLRGRELFGIDFRGNLEARDPAGLLATHTHRFPLQKIVGSGEWAVGRSKPPTARCPLPTFIVSARGLQPSVPPRRPSSFSPRPGPS